MFFPDHPITSLVTAGDVGLLAVQRSALSRDEKAYQTDIRGNSA